MAVSFRPGDVVVYRKHKNSSAPGPHARDVWPSPRGDTYSYFIDKFWRVIALRPDGTLVVRTRKGKQNSVAADNPNLRRVHWWERLLFRRRFPPDPAGK